MYTHLYLKNFSNLPRVDMASFPTDWSVYDVDQFAAYSVDEMDTDLGMNTLMKMDEKGRSTGVYKIPCLAAASWRLVTPLSTSCTTHHSV
jgi:hypothetical protein